MSEIKPESARERDLYKAIGSTPAGKELIEIWKNKLATIKSFPPELSEAHCRYVSGRHSIMIDIIKANMEK